MKYRKKPVVVDAFQWEGPWHNRSVVKKVSIDGDASSVGGEQVRFYVTTAHGQDAFLVPGDWVIAEPDGRGHYPCKPDIFAATYEPAEVTS